MANRQSAPAAPQASAPENTARAVIQRSALPGWFWGVLGCLSVLGVGFSVLIVVARNGLLDRGAVAPAPAATPAAPAQATGPAGTRPQPQIEQLVPPPSAPLIPAGEPKPRTQPHAIRLARSPSGGHAAAADKPADDKPAADKPAADKPAADKPGADKSAAASDEAVPAKKPTDKAAGDDDQVVRHHKAAASDEDDDDN